ncbi:MAG: response regulator [Desulfobulbaceae bacterium]|nr:response regulator [Desulfobulbaceae bacterium]
MTNFFDDVFADIADGDEDLRDLLQHLSNILPDAAVVIYSDRGTVIGDPLPQFSTEMLDGCREQADCTTVKSLCQLPTGEWLNGIRVDEHQALFFIVAEGQKTTLSEVPQLATLYHNSIKLALLQKIHEEAVIENEQLGRRIEVVSSKHTQLLDDNHRQFLLIREKEKEYAKKLESEIARQTKVLRKTNARLEEASRLKSEFLANMSHELRTPLNAIIGFIGLLSETELTVEQAEFADTIKKASSSLLVLINDILDLAKIEAGKLELYVDSFNLDGLAKNAEEMFRSQALEKNNTLKYRIDPSLPSHLIGDENRLRQILINLVGNALKFTSKGEVAIEVDKIDDTEEDVRLRFSVKDTGIGIPKERQKAIFDKFTQADGSTTRKYGGTGLGLAITNQLVSLMGGKIGIESIEGKGSTFSFIICLKKSEAQKETLPVDSGVESESTGVSERTEAEDGRTEKKAVETGLKILVVEDNLVNQRLVSIMLKKAGCSSDVAGDGVKALEKLKANQYDFVLMDVQMPNMDGHAATRKIREIESSEEKESFRSLVGRSKPLYIVGLTAHARKEDELQCYEAGMDHYLTKPIVKEKLMQVIEDMRRQKA